MDLCKGYVIKLDVHHPPPLVRRTKKRRMANEIKTLARGALALIDGAVF